MKPQSPTLLHHADHAKAKAAVETALAALNKRKAALAEAEAKATIVCCRCASHYAIATQVYVQTHWYVSPHGCTGGDYWNEGEGNWKCPDCGFVNRFDAKDGGWMGQPEIVAAKNHFESVRDCYCDYHSTCSNCRAASAAIRGAR